VHSFADSFFTYASDIIPECLFRLILFDLLFNFGWSLLYFLCFFFFRLYFHLFHLIRFKSIALTRTNGNKIINIIRFIINWYVLFRSLSFLSFDEVIFDNWITSPIRVCFHFVQELVMPFRLIRHLLIIFELLPW